MAVAVRVSSTRRPTRLRTRIPLLSTLRIKAVEVLGTLNPTTTKALLCRRHQINRPTHRPTRLVFIPVTNIPSPPSKIVHIEVVTADFEACTSAVLIADHQLQAPLPHLAYKAVEAVVALQPNSPTYRGHRHPALEVAGRLPKLHALRPFLRMF